MSPLSQTAELDYEAAKQPFFQQIYVDNFKNVNKPTNRNFTVRLKELIYLI